MKKRKREIVNRHLTRILNELPIEYVLMIQNCNSTYYAYIQKDLHFWKQRWNQYKTIVIPKTISLTVKSMIACIEWKKDFLENYLQYELKTKFEKWFYDSDTIFYYRLKNMEWNPKSNDFTCCLLWNKALFKNEEMSDNFTDTINKNTIFDGKTYGDILSHQKMVLKNAYVVFCLIIHYIVSFHKKNDFSSRFDQFMQKSDQYGDFFYLEIQQSGLCGTILLSHVQLWLSNSRPFGVKFQLLDYLYHEYLKQKYINGIDLF